MGSFKAPGPDGLNGHFYHHHWGETCADILKTVREFMSSDVLDPSMNRTLISLIPKVPNPENLSQYRPISLCNFVYKIISKILANRLKPWLPQLIEVELSAFIGGQQIQDNILVVQEVLHQLRTRKRKKKFQAILKLNMQKAYHRIEWDFLEACMLKMGLGFCGKWVRWIMQCVTTVSFSVKFNDEPLPYFQPSRGIRQGCPQRPRQNMAQELRVPESEKTGKHLGIPSDWGASKKDMFAWILARVNKKVEGWKENLISKAGKEVPLKAVIQAIPQYATSIFKIPISMCRAIEKKIAAFWWKNGESKIGIHWRKWELLKTRKDKGGLGFEIWLPSIRPRSVSKPGG